MCKDREVASGCVDAFDEAELTPSGSAEAFAPRSECKPVQAVLRGPFPLKHSLRHADVPVETRADKVAHLLLDDAAQHDEPLGAGVSELACHMHNGEAAQSQ